MCAARHTRRSPVFPAKLVPGPDRGAGIHPATHPSFPRSLSPAPTGEREPIPPPTRLSRESLPPAPSGERESIPPLTRLSPEACPRPRPGSGNPSRRSPIIPAKLVPGPPGSGNPSRRSFPRSLSPAPTGEPIPPLTCLSREACPRPRPGSGSPSRRSPVIPAKAGIHTVLMLDCHWTSPKRMGKQESSQ